MSIKGSLIGILVSNLFVFYEFNPVFVPLIMIEPIFIIVPFTEIFKPEMFYLIASSICLLTGQITILVHIITKKHNQFFIHTSILLLIIGLGLTYFSVMEVSDDDDSALPILTSIPFLTFIIYYLTKIHYSIKQ
jgi:hypothetical protein